MNQTGFDIRFYNGGMWGQGIYFAEDASCSDGYAFTKGNEKQLFFCNVLLGDCIRLQSDNSLRKPPRNPRSNQSYDSVMGHTGGSNVYIIYDNKKAYPSFLVTYRD